MIKKNSISAYLILLLLLAFGVVLYCQTPSLKNRFIIPSDVNTYIFPIYSLQNPELFRNDLIAQYSLSRMPLGYIYLFYFLGNFFNLISLTKILPFALTIMSVVYIFILGKEISSKIGGFVMSFLFIFHSWTFQTFQGSGPRAFVYPLLIPFLYYLCKKKYYNCFVLFVLQILFYPPAAVIALLTFLFSIISLNNKKLDIKCPLSIIVIFIISLPLFYLLQFSGSFGPTIDFKGMLKMPEFYPEGRDEFFFYNIKQFLESTRSGIGLNAAFIFLFALFFIFWIFKKANGIKTGPPRLITSLCLSSFILYILAYVFLFKLFFPARYIIFSIPLALCISIGILFDEVQKHVFSDAAKNLTFACFIILVSLFYIPKTDACTQDYTYLKDVVKYLSNVPEDSIIASTPSISDPIPTFARRKVLFSQKLMLSFHSEYYKKIQKRVYDFCYAYYSDSWEVIKSFCLRYSVDYIILNKNDFSGKDNNNEIGFPEPFRGYIEKIKRERNNFFLPNIAKSKIVFENSSFLIINTKEFR